MGSWRDGERMGMGVPSIQGHEYGGRKKVPIEFSIISRGSAELDEFDEFD